jgi:hypothetical protein
LNVATPAAKKPWKSWRKKQQFPDEFVELTQQTPMLDNCSPNDIGPLQPHSATTLQGEIGLLPLTLAIQFFFALFLVMELTPKGLRVFLLKIASKQPLLKAS